MPHAHGNGALEQVARETMRIVSAGAYTAPSGARVSLGASVTKAVAGTATFSSELLDALLADRSASTVPAAGRPRVEVTGETTQEATLRLVVNEAKGDVALLNFASAKRPGGGFLRGAKAQEEDLARCSALFACLEPRTAFYAPHAKGGSELYSDEMIHSPRVPFFRVRSEGLLEAVFEASVITAAAPNATRALQEGVGLAEIEAVFRRRTGKVLALAEAKGHRVLVLGAWGCGVFGNDPVMAADAFGAWLEHPRFDGSFDRVVFAVYDPRPDKPSYTPFAARLSA